MNYGKIAHAIMEATDDGNSPRAVINSIFGIDSNDMNKFFDWCEENEFEIIVKLYYDEIG